MKSNQVQMGDVRIGQVYERVGKGTTCRVVAVNTEPYPHAVVETVGGPTAGRRTTRRDMGGLRLAEPEVERVDSPDATILPFDGGTSASTDATLRNDIVALRGDIVALRKTIWSAIHVAERWADSEALGRRTL